MAPFVFSIPIYFSELWQILSIYCQTKENSPLLMKSFWFKFIISFKWFCNHYLNIASNMWRYCSFDAMLYVLNTPKNWIYHMFFSKFWLVGGKEWLTNGNALHPKWDVIGWNLSQFNLHYVTKFAPQRIDTIFNRSS